MVVEISPCLFCGVCNCSTTSDRSFFNCEKSFQKGPRYTYQKNQVFQRYFDAIYNPCDIHLTIYDPTLPLKQKITEKTYDFESSSLCN